MLEVYREIDRQLGCVLEAVDDQQADTSLLLFSLHGMEPNRAQDHFLGEILARLNRIYLGQPILQSDKPKNRNAMAYLRQALPATMQYRTANFVGERIQDWVVNRSLVAGHDWHVTPSMQSSGAAKDLSVSM